MKKQKILKLILVTVISISLIGLSGMAYADDTTSYLDLNVTPNTGNDTTTNPGTDTTTPTDTTIDIGTTTPNTPTTTTPNTETTTNNYNTSLPKTGIAENTMLVAMGLGLAGLAVIAFKKVNEYKDI